MTAHMQPDLLTSLEAARSWLLQNLDDGAQCPCCNQRAQAYRRTIHTSMATGLIKVYLAGPEGSWIEIAKILAHRELADFGKLAYWSLAEPQPGEREDGSKRVGIWRVTELGTQFVERTAKVMKTAIVYDGKPLKLEGEQVSITDCLGRKFDYRALMQGTA